MLIDIDMPTGIGVPERIVLHIAVAIERLGIGWPPRYACLLALLVAHLEPERLLILPIQPTHKPRLVEVHRQWLQRDPVHTPACTPWHDAIRRHEAPEHRVVQPRLVIQQPGA